MKRRGYGKGWWYESQRHSLAARGIRTVYDEVEDGEFSANPRSIAAMMRAKRIKAMEGQIDTGYDRLKSRRDALNAMYDRDERRLLGVYHDSDEIPDEPLRAGGVWDKVKSGAKKVGSGLKKVGSKTVSGVKWIGGKAKKVGGKIKEKATPALSKAKEWGGKAWEATKSGASWVGEKAQAGGSWIKEKLFPSPAVKAKKEKRFVDQLAADNLADQMSIDDLHAEQERLDRSNRALMADWATRQKWVDYRWDNLERKKRLLAMQNKKQKLEEEMYR